MKMKKMVVGLLLVLGIVGFCATNVFAVEGNYTCTVSRVGGYAGTNGPMYVTLENSAFPNGILVCRIPEGRLNQTLAVLLSAASNAASVFVRVDPDLPQAERLLKFVYYNVQ